MAEHQDLPIYIPEICKVIGVAERTLRVCCQEQLGTSLKHFLLMGRMQFARRDLSKADPEATTVSKVATRYSFWQFGQFAGEYKSMFGELPSATLARDGDLFPTTRADATGVSKHVPGGLLLSGGDPV